MAEPSSDVHEFAGIDGGSRQSGSFDRRICGSTESCEAEFLVRELKKEGSLP